jgi:predicted transcriptional regulator
VSGLSPLQCEIAAKELMPALRAALAITMVREYGLSVYRTAKLLNIAPAAVSNYLAERRSNKKLVRKLLEEKEYAVYVKEYSIKIIRNEVKVDEVMCFFCKLLYG